MSSVVLQFRCWRHRLYRLVLCIFRFSKQPLLLVKENMEDISPNFSNFWVCHVLRNLFLYVRRFEMLVLRWQYRIRVQSRPQTWWHLNSWRFELLRLIFLICNICRMLCWPVSKYHEFTNRFYYKNIFNCQYYHLFIQSCVQYHWQI